MIFAAYGPGYGAVPTSAASMAATSGGYPDYSQMTAASQAGMPAAAPGSQPRLETPTATDYSAYGEKACRCSAAWHVQACFALRLKAPLRDY